MVKNLTYRVVKPDKYVSDELVEHTDAVACFALTDGLLHVSLNVAADSGSSARSCVEPTVRSWEFEAEVRSGFPVIEFDFVQDIDEATPTSLASAEELADGTGLVILSRYPPGPTIAVTPEMESIWKRYVRARLDFGEPLQSAVYYALTVIEAQFGSRSKASSALKLDPQILRKMGELSSTRGDPETARKARAADVPLRIVDRQWLDAAVRHAVLQLGHLAARLSPRPVVMADLPDL